MKRSPIFLVLFLLCVACTHQSVDPRKEEDAAINLLGRPEAEIRLAETLKELSDVDQQLRSAEARRESNEAEATQNVDKQGAVVGSDAEISTLQAKRGAIMHRQHVLEGRLRELGADQTPEQ